MLTWTTNYYDIWLYTKNKQLEFIVEVSITYLGTTNKNNNSFCGDSGDGELGYNSVKKNM